MTAEEWTAVDDYVNALVVAEDDALLRALSAATDAGLPPISVSAPQGKLLHLLARLCGARTVLEIGTLAGYSTIWLARALPADGRVVTLEIDPRHAEVARANLDRAGLAEKVDIRVGSALDTLPTLADQAPFDLVFIDADKPSNPAYFSWAVKLSRPGTVIVVDNVVRRGSVLDETSGDPAVQGSRAVLEMIAAEPRVDATVLQMVGGKGWDGFALAVVS